MAEQAHVLVFTPHPDDAEFGASGTVANMVREGKNVVYVVCTRGDKGTSDRNMKPEELVKIRQQEQREAAKTLGVREVVFLPFDDQTLEDTSEFRKEIVRQIRIFRPEIVFASDPYRRYLWHRDHRVSGQVVLDAVFPYARDHLAYPDLLEEGLEPHKVSEVWLWGTEDPNFRTDITDTFDTKIAALRCHKSQVGDFTNLEEFLREWAVERAQGEKFELGEAFHRVEMWW